MLNMPRGRLRTEDGATRLAAIDTYDRYGFVNLPSMDGTDQNAADGIEAQLVASLGTSMNERIEAKTKGQIALIDAWETYMGELPGGNAQPSSPPALQPGGASRNSKRSASPEMKISMIFRSGGSSSNGEDAEVPYPKFERCARSEQLIQSGVPSKCRQEVWTRLINMWVGDIRKEVGPDYYNRMWDLTDKDIKPMPPTGFLKQVDLDLLRTFPTNKYFLRDGPAINKLRRILVAFMRHSPRIGYCQGFNFLAGFALLFLSEEMAFWCLVTLIDHIMPKLYFVDPMTESRADQPVLRELVAEHLGGVEDMLNAQNFDLSLVSFNWFFTLYVDTVPIDVTLRIWDQLLYEGDFVLFRVAHSLLASAQDGLVGLDSPGDVFDAMRNLGKQCDDIEALFFMINNKCPFSKEHIRARRVVHTEELIDSDAKIMTQVKAQQAKRKAEREAKAAKAAQLERDRTLGHQSTTAREIEPSPGSGGIAATAGTSTLTQKTEVKSTPVPVTPAPVADVTNTDDGTGPLNIMNIAMPSAATAPLLITKENQQWDLAPAPGNSFEDAGLATPTSKSEPFSRSRSAEVDRQSTTTVAAVEAAREGPWPVESFDDEIERTMSHSNLNRGLLDNHEESSSPHESATTSPQESGTESAHHSPLQRPASVDSWVQIDVEEKEEAPPPPRDNFITQHATDYALTPKMTGGTGDGYVLLGHGPHCCA
jgi:hypothetical protein